MTIEFVITCTKFSVDGLHTFTTIPLTAIFLISLKFPLFRQFLLATGHFLLGSLLLTPHLAHQVRLSKCLVNVITKPNIHDKRKKPNEFVVTSFEDPIIYHVY